MSGRAHEDDAHFCICFTISVYYALYYTYIYATPIYAACVRIQATFLCSCIYNSTLARVHRKVLLIVTLCNIIWLTSLMVFFNGYTYAKKLMCLFGFILRYIYIYFASGCSILYQFVYMKTNFWCSAHKPEFVDKFYV